MIKTDQHPEFDLDEGPRHEKVILYNIGTPSVFLDEGRGEVYRYKIRYLEHLYNPMYRFSLIPTSTIISPINRFKFYPSKRTQ